MAEKEEKTEKKNKRDSRKFVVWMVWVFVTLFVVAWCAAVMIITKQIEESLVTLAEKVLNYFFAVSMMYLGMNVGQKMGYAFTDALTAKYESGNKGE